MVDGSKNSRAADLKEIIWCKTSEDINFGDYAIEWLFRILC
jgi:hypothetical protein